MIVVQLELQKDWRAWLAYTVAHEYHHSVWHALFPNRQLESLADSLVFEGRADSFARLIYHNLYAPWLNAFPSDQAHLVWSRAKSALQVKDRSTIMQYILGFEGFPQWGGVHLGLSDCAKLSQKSAGVRRSAMDEARFNGDYPRK
ncbi:MAG: DUF2268 domain-containing putative Zn-dependent protease [Chloroflexota bacterium]